MTKTPNTPTYLTALTLLARREHTEAELIRKLKSKKHPDEAIHQALSQLTTEGKLSHHRFIEEYIHSRSNKGYGPLRIKAELLERGLKEDFIEHHLDMTDNAWLINIRAVWQKHFKSQRPTDFKTRAKQMRFLYYRGFTQEQIESIFDNSEEP